MLKGKITDLPEAEPPDLENGAFVFFPNDGSPAIRCSIEDIADFVMEYIEKKKPDFVW